MKTRKILIITMLMWLLVISSCKDDALSNNNPIEEQPRENLVGTKWKLVGFFDIETGDIIEVLPSKNDCEYCYTLDFMYSNTSGVGKVFFVEFAFRISNNELPVFYWAHLDDTRPDDSGCDEGNAYLFYRAVKYATHYEVVRDILRIYYDDKFDNNKKKYLLYKEMK